MAKPKKKSSKKKQMSEKMVQLLYHLATNWHERHAYFANPERYLKNKGLPKFEYDILVREAKTEMARIKKKNRTVGGFEHTYGRSFLITTDDPGGLG
jgi:hypothetical protein